MHLAINVYSFTTIGQEVESSFSSKRFIPLYVTSIIGGNVLSHSACVRGLPGTSPLSVGASGGVFGLFGAYYVFLRTNGDFFTPSGVEAGLDSLKTTLFVNVVNGLVSNRIDNYAHLGGACAGGVYAYGWGPRLKRGGNGRVYDYPRFDELVDWFGKGRRGEGEGVKVRKIPRLPSYVG